MFHRITQKTIGTTPSIIVQMMMVFTPKVAYFQGLEITSKYS
jgi:hypothetical protein